MNITLKSDYLNSTDSTAQNQAVCQFNYIKNDDKVANQSSQPQISQIKIEQCPPQNITINLNDELASFAKKKKSSNLKKLYSQFIETRDINVKIYDNKNLTLLHYAILSGNLKITKLLLQAGADANTTNSKGQTPLHLVSRSKNPGVVDLLIQYGAKIDTKDDQGNTPLHHLYKDKNEETIKSLLQYKANVNAKNNKGQTLFDRAAKRGHFETMSLLLKVRKLEYTTRKDQHGNTAVHYAISYKNRNATELLISNGADINAKNNQDETPLNIAAKKSQKDIVDLLLNTEKVEDVNAKDINGKLLYIML